MKKNKDTLNKLIPHLLHRNNITYFKYLPYRFGIY